LITFVLYGLSTVLEASVPGTVYWLSSLIDGLLFLPLTSLGLAPIAGRITREKLSRLHLKQAVFPMDALGLVLTRWGYVLAPADREAGTVTLSDGSTLQLDADQTWYRLAGRPFAITYQPTEGVLQDVLAHDIDLANVTFGEGGEQRTVDAVFDGWGVLKRARGGLHGWTPYHDGVEDGFLVSLSRAINSLRGGGGPRLSEHTERMTRVEKGGTAAISGSAQMYAYIGTILLGAVFGTLIFGVL